MVDWFTNLLGFSFVLGVVGIECILSLSVIGVTLEPRDTKLFDIVLRTSFYTGKLPFAGSANGIAVLPLLAVSF